MFLLKLLSWDTIVSFIVTYLATTVKNPKSDQARKLLSVAKRLHAATGQFILEVEGREPVFMESSILKDAWRGITS